MNLNWRTNRELPRGNRTVIIKTLDPHQPRIELGHLDSRGYFESQDSYLAPMSWDYVDRWIYAVELLHTIPDANGQKGRPLVAVFSEEGNHGTPKT